MPQEYHIFKVYIGDKYYVAITPDPYPKRALSNCRKSKDYKKLFDDEIANICFTKTIHALSLGKAKAEKNLYLQNNKEYIESLTETSNKKVNKTEKIKSLKNVSRPDKMRVLIQVGAIKCEDINELMVYNEFKKQERKDKPIFDRDLLTGKDYEVIYAKYNNVCASLVRKSDDLFYCDCCGMLMNGFNRKRHFVSATHIENLKNEKVKEPLMVD